MDIQTGKRHKTCRAGHEWKPETTGEKMIGNRVSRSCLICERARYAARPKIIPGVTIEMMERKRELAAIVAKTQSDTARAEWRELTERINAARAAVGGAA